MNASADRSTVNRSNAVHSTGPRTAEGKARSRWNALTHGLYARTLTPAAALLEEDLAEFQSLREALLEEYAPEGLAEERMIEKMALLCWQHDRLVACSEQRLAVRLKAGDDTVTALIGRETTTMAESLLDRAISRIHRDLLFLARYRERNREADARRRAKTPIEDRLALLEAAAEHLLIQPGVTQDGENLLSEDAPETREPDVARKARISGAMTSFTPDAQTESPVEREASHECDGTKPDAGRVADAIASAA
jgi:hypothetical protein